MSKFMYVIGLALSKSIRRCHAYKLIYVIGLMISGTDEKIAMSK